MEVIYLLIGFSLLVALVFLGLFFWAVRSGQFDDSYTPSIRILFDKTDTDSKQELSSNHKQDKD